MAKKIALHNNLEGVKELVDNLINKDKKVQSDCIKTLYEIGFLKPILIADYHTEFIALLTSKNNRLVWGGMIALLTITDLRANEIFTTLDLIVETVEKGSVVTIDCGVEILPKLNKYSKYSDNVELLFNKIIVEMPNKIIATVY